MLEENDPKKKEEIDPVKASEQVQKETIESQNQDHDPPHSDSQEIHSKDDISQSTTIGDDAEFGSTIIGGKDNLLLNHSIIQNIFEDTSKKRYDDYDKEASFNIEKYRYSDEELRKIDKTFVESKSFEKLKTQIRGRLLIITGGEGAGKFTAALYLGSILKAESVIENIYILSDSETIAPNVLLNKLPSQSFLVIVNAFEEDSSSFAKKLFGKADHARITQIRNSLKESYIVAVSNIELPAFTAKAQQDLADAGILIEQFERPDPKEILKKHMAYTLTKEQINRIDGIIEKDEMQEIVARLDTPKKIVKFIEYSLSKIDPLIESNRLREYLVKEINNLLDIRSEVNKFYEELSDQGKALAITLSLFHGTSESNLWHTHKRVTPVRVLEPTSDGDEEESKPISPFVLSKSNLLKEIRASVDSTRTKALAGESLITQVKFDDERYPSEILTHVKSNYPDYLEDLINSLIEFLIESSKDLEQRIAIARAIGKIASVNWPTVKQLIIECANNDDPKKRAITGHILDTAIQDKLINEEGSDILLRWSELKVNEANWKLIWSAASSYKQIGQSNIRFALAGLKRILMGINSRLEAISFHGMNQVLKSVNYAIIVLSLAGYLSQIIEALLKWINELDEKESNLDKFVIALVWIDIASVYSDFAQQTNSQNEIITLISQDEEALLSLSKLIAHVFVTLHHGFKIYGKPMSGVLFDISKDWILSSNDVNNRVTVDLIKHAGKNLKQSNKKYYDYFTAYIRKFWLAEKQKKTVKLAAKAILRK